MNLNTSELKTKFLPYLITFNDWFTYCKLHAALFCFIDAGFIDCLCHYSNRVWCVYCVHMCVHTCMYVCVCVDIALTSLNQFLSVVIRL